MMVKIITMTIAIVMAIMIIIIPDLAA